jgi:hypothetical protein
MWVILGGLGWMRRCFIVCSRFLSCLLIICCVCIVVPVEQVLSHCCNMCYFVYCSGSASCLTLMSSCGGCCFLSFYDFFFVFLLCCLLCLWEHCLVTWLLGAVMLVVLLELVWGSCYEKDECCLLYSYKKLSMVMVSAVNGWTHLFL